MLATEDFVRVTDEEWAGEMQQWGGGSKQPEIRGGGEQDSCAGILRMAASLPVQYGMILPVTRSLCKWWRGQTDQ